MNLQLNHFQSDAFLANYWQQMPLFIEQGITNFSSPLDIDELAGLACENEFISRLITEYSPNDWQLEYGPFSEDTLTHLPITNWSLLIQDLDKHFYEYESLLGYFDFIPRWRMDDVMISLSPDGASVGPHTDNYDVFLYQLHGNKAWHINQHSYSPEIRTDCELSILQPFTAEQTYLARPGDLLYLPPGVAHHGIAQTQDDALCVTVSIGFRAPTDVDLIMAWMEEKTSRNHINFYSDKYRSATSASQTLWLDDKDREALHQQMRKALNPAGAEEIKDFQLWLGNYLTQIKPELLDFTEAATGIDNKITLQELAASESSELRKKPCCRTLLQHINNQLAAHINGQCCLFPTTHEYMLEELLGNKPVKLSAIMDYISDKMNDENLLAGLETLLSTGCFTIT